MSESTVQSAETSKTVYLFYGEDSFRAYEKLKFWREQFELKYGDFNSQVFYGEELKAAELKSALEAYPFLGEKKLIIIYDFLANGKEDNLKESAQLLSSVGEHCVVIFFEHHKPDSRKVLFKSIQKHGKLEEFTGLSGVSLMQWVEEKCKKSGLKVEPKALKYFVEMTGNNLWIVTNEIKKLALFANGSTVTVSMIDQVVSFNLTSNIFKLTDALGSKQVTDALNILKILLDNDESLVAILFALVAHIRAMVQVKALMAIGLKPAAIAKKLKKHPFLINKVSAQVKSFSADTLNTLYRKLAEIDAALKTGKIRISGGDNTELQRYFEKMLIEME